MDFDRAEKIWDTARRVTATVLLGLDTLRREVTVLKDANKNSKATVHHIK